LVPIWIPMANLSAEPFLLVEAEDGMPCDVLAQGDQVQATESSIGHQGTVLACEIRGNLIKEMSTDFPLPLIPFFLLWHDTPSKW
jgi:hypothetical protein